jgi:predicted ATPase
LILLPAVDEVLECPFCGHQRPFRRPPLLIVTGTAGAGKSTLCARLAGTIPGAVLLDADIFADALVSVVSPNPDYPAFWRTMMRLAHEIAQNNVVVVYFSVMLPEQATANADVLRYFESVNFLCLTCSPEVLRSRLARRVGLGESTGDMTAAASAAGTLGSRLQVWVDFNQTLLAAARGTSMATVLDADPTVEQVEDDVRHWITTELDRWATAGHPQPGREAKP